LILVALPASPGVLLGGTAARTCTIPRIVPAAVLFLFAAATAVRGTPALAGDFALLLGIHGREATSAIGAVAAALAPTAALAPATFLFPTILLFAAATAVRGAPALAGDFALFLRIHGRETAPPAPGTLASLAAATFLFPTFALPRASTALPRLASFFFIPFVGIAALMSRAPALAGDFTLLLGVHGGETAGTATVAVSGLTVTVGDPTVTLAFLFVATFMVFGRLTMVVGSGFVEESRLPMMRGQTALAADFGHVLAIAAHGLATLATRRAGFFLIPFMRFATFVGRTTALAGDFALLFGIHGGKAAFVFTCHAAISSSKSGGYTSPVFEKYWTNYADNLQAQSSERHCQTWGGVRPGIAPRPGSPPPLRHHVPRPQKPLRWLPWNQVL